MNEQDLAARLEQMADESLSWKDDGTLREAAAELRRLRAVLNEVAELNQPNLEQLMAMSIEVQELKAALASAQGPEEQ